MCLHVPYDYLLRRKNSHDLLYLLSVRMLVPDWKRQLLVQNSYLFQKPIMTSAFTIDCDPDFKQFSHIIQVHFNKIHSSSFKPRLVFIEYKLWSGAISAKHCHGYGRVCSSWFYIPCVHLYLILYICKEIIDFIITKNNRLYKKTNATYVTSTLFFSRLTPAFSWVYLIKNEDLSD